MQSTLTPAALELLPFWVTCPGGTALLKIAVAVVLVLVLLGFSALHFTIQAIPDRMASGMHKVQMQFVGVLGLLPLVTMNNAYWITAILVAGSFSSRSRAHSAASRISASVSPASRRRRLPWRSSPG